MAESSGANAGEFFTTLNQAAIDPATKDLFEKSPMAQEILRKLWTAHGYNKGGLVYASTGALIPDQPGAMVAYQPKGTDRIPAMLSKGEYVMNNTATANNLPALNYMNNGGIIKP
jgi:hypothetical protein